MEYDKPFKTYREQIDILKNRYGLIIEDEDFAEAALKSLTYYDLVNGYKDCFMEKERFIEGMTIDFIYLFSLVDKGIPVSYTHLDVYKRQIHSGSGSLMLCRNRKAYAAV